MGRSVASRISQKKMRKMRLFQRDAYISIDFLESVTELFRLTDGTSGGISTMKLGEIQTGTRKRSIVYEKPEIREINPLQYELGEFLKAIVQGGAPVVSGAEGLMALEVAHTILDRIKDQKIQF